MVDCFVSHSLSTQVRKMARLMFLFSSASVQIPALRSSRLRLTSVLISEKVGWLRLTVEATQLRWYLRPRPGSNGSQTTCQFESRPARKRGREIVYYGCGLSPSTSP